MESLLLFALIGGFLYFFMIAPQRRKMKAHRQLLSSLKHGDEVLTNAGIFGAVAEVEDNVVWLEVAPDVELKVQKMAVVKVISQSDNPESADASGNSDDADDAEDSEDDSSGSNHASDKPD